MTDVDESPERNGQSLGGLFKLLSKQISKLARQQVALARAEMAQKAGGVGQAAVLLGAGAMLAFLAAGVLAACCVLALALVLPGWLAALVVGVACLLGAGVLVVTGARRAKKTGRPVPKETIETVKESVPWTKHPKGSAER